MKKYSIILAAALLAVSIASCKKDEKNVGFTEPTMKESATKFTVSKTASSVYKGFEATEDGLYIIPTDKGIKTGTYKHTKKAASDLYECEGFGKVEIIDLSRATGFEIVFTPTGQEPVKISATPVETPSATGTTAQTINKIVNTWKVKQTIVTLTGEGLPEALAAAHTEPGFNLPAWKNYIAEVGKYTIDYDFTGYVVKDVTLTEAGTLLIRFEGADPFVAEWELASNGTFSYELAYEQEGNPLINASATGKVTTDEAKGTCDITIDVTVDSKQNYKGKVIIKLGK